MSVVGPILDAFFSGLVLGFMFGMIFVVICWMWVDAKENE